jgi:hypothetical protein
MDPEESEMVAAATEKDPIIVTSKFPLKEPSKGGNQREGEDLSFQAKICLSKLNKI